MVVLMNDENRLLGAKEAMEFLSMRRTTFYKNIKRGFVPRARYFGATPVWRLGDLRAVYDQLPDKPVLGGSVLRSVGKK